MTSMKNDNENISAAAPPVVSMGQQVQTQDSIEHLISSSVACGTGGADRRSAAVVVNDGDVLDDSEVSDNSQQQQEQQTSNKGKSVKVAFLLISCILCVVTEDVLFKLLSDAYGERLSFAAWNITDQSYTVATLLVVLFRTARGSITKDQRQRFPLWIFLLIGLNDSLIGFFFSISAVHTPGTLQGLLSQLTVPFTMLLGYVVIKTRFIWQEYFGALLIIVGAAAGTVGIITNSGLVAEGETTWWSSILMFSLANALIASSFVSKEYVMKQGVDVFYTSLLVSVAATLLSGIFTPLLSLHAFSGTQAQPLSQIPDGFRDAAKCLVGIPAPKNLAAAALYDNPHANLTQMFGNGKDAVPTYCRAGYWIPVMAFVDLITGTIVQWTALFLAKEATAALGLLSTAISLPLKNLAFSIPLFVGGKKKAEPFTAWDIAGLVLVTLGTTLYQYTSLRTMCPKRCGGSETPADAGDNRNFNATTEAGAEDEEAEPERVSLLTNKPSTSTIL